MGGAGSAGATGSTGSAGSITTGETLLAFDFGEKRIGVAVGNTLLRQARALTTLQVVTVAERFAAVAALLEEWRPQRLVVGIPANDDGTPHVMTARCRRFANQLHGRYGLPVELVDERYTSAAAASERRAALQANATRGRARDAAARQAIDALAAQIILQSWFDHAPDPIA